MAAQNGYLCLKDEMRDDLVAAGTSHKHLSVNVFRDTIMTSQNDFSILANSFQASHYLQAI